MVLSLKGPGTCLLTISSSKLPRLSAKSVLCVKEMLGFVETAGKFGRNLSRCCTVLDTNASCLAIGAS